MVFDRKKFGIAGLFITVLLMFMVFSTGCVNNTVEKTQVGTSVPTAGPTQVTSSVATQGATTAASNPIATQAHCRKSDYQGIRIYNGPPNCSERSRCLHDCSSGHEHPGIRRWVRCRCPADWG